MFLKRLNLWEMFGSYNLPSPSWGLLLYEQSGCILRTAVDADVGVSYLVHRTQSLLTEAAMWSFSCHFFLCREHEGKDTNTTSWARAKEPALGGVFSKGGGRDFHSLWNSRCLLMFKTSFPVLKDWHLRLCIPLLCGFIPVSIYFSGSGRIFSGPGCSDTSLRSFCLSCRTYLLIWLCHY